MSRVSCLVFRGYMIASVSRLGVRYAHPLIHQQIPHLTANLASCTHPCLTSTCYAPCLQSSPHPISVTRHAYDQLRTPSPPPHLQHSSLTRPLTPYLLSFIRTPDLIPLPLPSACIRSFASARLYPYYVITVSRRTYYMLYTSI